MLELAKKFYNELLNSSNQSFVKQKASFLLFASYALDDVSLYPYWIVLEEKHKLDIIDSCPSTEARNKIINSILPYRGKFWEYLKDNIVFVNRNNLEVQVYPDFVNFIIYSFVIKDKCYSEKDLQILKCQEAIEYFDYLFRELKRRYKTEEEWHLKIYNDWLYFKNLEKARLKIKRALVQLSEK